jgi:hypothetical protein
VETEKSNQINKRDVKKVNKILVELKVEQYPDKTLIGRSERGFDFLGYSFKPGPRGLLSISNHTPPNSLDHQSGPTTGDSRRGTQWSVVCSMLCPGNNIHRNLGMDTIGNLDNSMY